MKQFSNICLGILVELLYIFLIIAGGLVISAGLLYFLKP